MKRVDLIRLLIKNGWAFEREGTKHTVYKKGSRIEEVPRHREINEELAKSIIRRNGLK
jgi:mRNA interferase HicA